jgi:hypothetical protein
MVGHDILPTSPLAAHGADGPIAASKPLPVEIFDRQGEQCFTRRGDENRPSPVEFAKAAADIGLPSAAE